MSAVFDFFIYVIDPKSRRDSQNPYKLYEILINPISILIKNANYVVFNHQTLNFTTEQTFLFLVRSVLSSNKLDKYNWQFFISWFYFILFQGRSAIDMLIQTYISHMSISRNFDQNLQEVATVKQEQVPYDTHLHIVLVYHSDLCNILE